MSPVKRRAALGRSRVDDMRGKTTRSVPDGKSEHTVWVSEGAGMTMESVRRVADYGCGVELRLARRTAQKT